MSSPRTPQEVRAILRTRWDRGLRQWLAAPEGAAVSVPLHPPTAAQALADPSPVAAWIQQWREAPAPLGEHAAWEERRWAQLGTQRVPVRWAATGAHLLTACAGDPVREEARVLTARYEAAVARLAAHAEVRGDALRKAVAVAVDRSRAQWLRLSAVDAELSIEVAAWLLAHPVSGLRIRQVPFPGMHTKWLRDHRALVSRLVGAARCDGSEDLGLAADPVFHDLVVLDPSLRRDEPGAAGVPAFPRSCRMPLSDLPGVGLAPRVVIVCENAESVQVLPDIPGTVALSGSGYSIPGLLQVPWVQAAPVVYWGDLDADGFRILDRARHHHARVRSVLMDERTLEDHRELAVTTAVRPAAALGRLTEAEHALHDALAASGTRLEQERIEWGYAVTRLREAVEQAGDGSAPSA